MTMVTYKKVGSWNRKEQNISGLRLELTSVGYQQKGDTLRQECILKGEEYSCGQYNLIPGYDKVIIE